MTTTAQRAALTPQQEGLLQSLQLVSEAAARSPKGVDLSDPWSCDCDTQADLRIVEAWHNEAHPGVFKFCDEQPCHALNHAR